MDMLISYFNGKDFLALYIYRNMYFQISFLIFYMPFLSHPLTSVRNLYTSAIYCDDDIFVFEFLAAFVIRIFYLDVQPVYSSIYCSVIRDGRDFAFSMALCNSFSSLSIRKMKVHFSIS